jgi:Ca2+-binding RTX toxin-like protein
MHIVREILDGGQVGDVDTAVFWDVVQNYTVTEEDDAYVIRHDTLGNPAVLPPGFTRVSDGTDTLRNIELVKFGDGLGGFRTFNIADLIQRPATGAAVLGGDLTPIEGQTLTVSTASIQDPNGITGPANFAFQWQSSVNGVDFIDIVGATGASLLIPDAAGTALGALHGLFLRSVVTLTDDIGGTQVFTTGPTTAPVGMNLDVSASLVGVTFTTGPATDDVMTGSNFDDVLWGLAGNDLIFGGGGNDSLMGGAGNDLLDGGAGLDTAHFSIALNDIENISLVAGTSDISVFNAAPPADYTDTLRSIEVLRFGAANFAVVIDGNVGGSTMEGGDGSQALFGGAGNDNLLGQVGDDILIGGAGNDDIRGGQGSDTIFQASTDGRDTIRGGNGAGVDTYILSGVAGAETFRIYTTAAWAALAGNNLASLNNAATEIVITRNGTDAASIIAELDGIEEIKVNSLLTTQNNGNNNLGPDGGPSDGDTIIVTGDFRATDLDYNTIRVSGSNANDTVDISGLQSDHRLVFNANGGTDTVIGSVRSQDIINGTVNDLRSTGGASFGAGDGIDALAGGPVGSALIGGSDAGEVSRGRTMIEMDQIFPLDTVETGPVEPVFVNDAPVELTERQVITDYLVS